MRRPALALLMLAAACDGGATEALTDAGAPLDAGDAGADAGASYDAGAPMDAAIGDAEVPRDAGAPLDVGLSMDAGDTLDAGALMDAGPAPSVPDPELGGPYLTARHEVSFRVAASRNTLPLDCYVPDGAPGPAPLVLIGHGFQLPASQYTSYATHLASFGFVACTADFEAGFLANHAENADDMIAGIDHLLELDAAPSGPLSGRIDESRIGITGHSLGGKVAFLVAARDARVGAVFGIDPVDSSMFCSEARCPDATDLLPLSIPVGVIGETLDSTGNQACAPADGNFQTFYDAASSPALQVDALGAGHMSFIDDPASCGLPCNVCNQGSTPAAEVLRLAKAMTAAFFLRHLAGEVGYETYLSGAIAQVRYVQPGLASITSK